MCAGVVSIFVALGLFCYDAHEDSRAGSSAQAVVAQLAQSTQNDTPPASSSILPDSDDMTTVDIDGYSYVGRLSIPALGLDLPIMANWTGDYEALKLAPCRQFGTPQGHDLVIAGHNYTSHFGGLSQLEVGDAVEFSDMDGRTWSYRVALVEVLEPTAVDAVRESPYDLTLYTCTFGGQSRVVVRCSLV